ncbi:hypothetical protein F5880DRAFT_369430 [Lentinula raphanica]|nr:hypothetical protein F5880DRAFT_369430 [Lentinula raphanica]
MMMTSFRLDTNQCIVFNGALMRFSQFLAFFLEQKFKTPWKDMLGNFRWRVDASFFRFSAGIFLIVSNNFRQLFEAERPKRQVIAI